MPSSARCPPGSARRAPDGGPPLGPCGPKAAGSLDEALRTRALLGRYSAAAGPRPGGNNLEGGLDHAAGPQVNRPRSLRKCPTGIGGFDEITFGGLPRDRATLVCGGPGWGKTLLGMEFLVHGITRFGEPGVFVSSTDTPRELGQNVSSLAGDLGAPEAEGKLVIDHVLVERSEILEEYVSDCVVFLDHRTSEEVSTSRLPVVKCRGSLHGTNEYPFLIDAGGISVLPVTSLDEGVLMGSARAAQKACAAAEKVVLEEVGRKKRREFERRRATIRAQVEALEAELAAEEEELGAYGAEVTAREQASERGRAAMAAIRGADHAAGGGAHG